MSQNSQLHDVSLRERTKATSHSWKSNTEKSLLTALASGENWEEENRPEWKRFRTWAHVAHGHHWRRCSPGWSERRCSHWKMWKLAREDWWGLIGWRPPGHWWCHWTPLWNAPACHSTHIEPWDINGWKKRRRRIREVCKGSRLIICNGKG